MLFFLYVFPVWEVSHFKLACVISLAVNVIGLTDTMKHADYCA